MQRSPEPPREKTPRQASRNSKGRSSLVTPRAGSLRADLYNHAEPTAVQSSANFGGRVSSRGVDPMGVRASSRGMDPAGVRASSRSGSGMTPQPVRASSRSGGLVPRSEEFERPASRAIGMFLLLCVG
jgi:hypothetical protein